MKQMADVVQVVSRFGQIQKLITKNGSIQNLNSSFPGKCNTMSLKTKEYPDVVTENTQLKSKIEVSIIVKEKCSELKCLRQYKVESDDVLFHHYLTFYVKQLIKHL